MKTSKKIQQKRIQQQLSMILNILTFVFDPIYQAILDSLPPYKDNCESLQTMAENVKAKLAIYRKLLKSLAEAKSAARIALANAAYPIMSKAYTYCITNGLTNDASQLKCTLFQLSHMPFEKLVIKMNTAIPIVQTLLPQLAAYNITAPAIAQWQSKLDTLDSLNSTPHNAIKQRKSQGEIITADMEAMLKFFNEQVTPLVAEFIESNPEYYISFQNIKRIGTGNIHHTRLLAHCQSELGVPYFGITVTVDEFTDPKTGKKYTAESSVTDSSGDCEVSGFFAAYRTVTISGQGVVSKSFQVQFERAKTVAKTFILQPSFTNIPAPQQTPQNQNA